MVLYIDMKDSMTQLFERLRNSENYGMNLYDDLAPLYNFVYERHYNYKNQYNFVQDVAPEGTNRVLEGACGAGQLTELLGEEYDVIGVDLNDGMLDEARERVPSVRFIQQDVNNLDIGGDFDMFVLLGASVIHMTEEGDIEKLAKNAWEHLDDGGVFAFDFFPTSEFENGHTGNSVFIGERFKVTRNHLSVACDDELYRLNFSFRIKDMNSGESVQTAETDLVRTFRPSYLRKILEDNGFNNIIHRSSDRWSDGAELEDLMIARE